MEIKKEKDLVWVLKNGLALLLIILLFGAILFVVDICLEDISIANRFRYYILKSYGTIFLAPFSPFFLYKGGKAYIKRKKRINNILKNAKKDI